METVLLIMKYYSRLDPHAPFPKFDYQIQALESMGKKVSYLMIENQKIYFCNNNSRDLILEYKLSGVPGLSNLDVYNSIYKAIVKILEKGHSFDLIYIRYMPVTYLFKKALKEMKNAKCKVVVEMPTFPVLKEIGKEKRVLRKLFFKLSKKYFDSLVNYIDLFTLIGEESSHYLSRPAINIENGISLDKISRRIPKFIENEIHILCLANMAKWHGYDRLIEGLNIYYAKEQKTKVILHIVGSDADGSKIVWNKLSKSYKLDEYVLFEGPKYGQDLNWYFDACQIAIGSIGLHRIGYNSAATLKVREYMARGIPFVLSAADQSINKKDIFYWKVSEDDTPIDIESLISYILDIKDWNLVGDEMREYAANKMTWEGQFLKVFSYFLKKECL